MREKSMVGMCDGGSREEWWVCVTGREEWWVCVMGDRGRNGGYV